MSTDQIHAENVDAVVYIESGWKLIDTATGRQVYHYYAPNEYTEIEHHLLGSTVKTLKRFPGIAAAYVPVYMRSGDSFVPVLTNTDDGGKNKAGRRAAGWKRIRGYGRRPYPDVPGYCLDMG